jgi:hypothetical protein
MTDINELSPEQIASLLSTGITFVETKTATIAPLNTASIKIYFADAASPVPHEPRVELNVMINNERKFYDMSASSLGVAVEPLFIAALHYVAQLSGVGFEILTPVSGS